MSTKKLRIKKEKEKVLRDKIEGALLGFMIGDAMGATTEFMTKEQIKKKYGRVRDIIGGGWLCLTPGDVTDDTQMTMCVANALMEYPDDIDNFTSKCMHNFVMWYRSNPPDVGNQCRKSIELFMHSGKPIHVENDALGNGSLMRALPCAILNKNKFNVAQGKLTHNNPECSRIILDYSRRLRSYLDMETYSGKYELPEKLLEPSGHIVNTYNNALYYVENEKTFRGVILSAVNDGGDADTIAAIAGSMAGAKFGKNKIPKEWIYDINFSAKNFANIFTNFVFSYVQT